MAMSYGNPIAKFDPFKTLYVSSFHIGLLWNWDKIIKHNINILPANKQGLEGPLVPSCKKF